MSAPIVVFSGLVLTSTLALVLAVVLAVDVLRKSESPLPRRIGVALVPPWAALDAARRGHRVLAGLFALAIVVYGALWIAAAAVAR
ncbi:MAG TPA: hypothetical protein VIL20_12775 [Sandaracinaceae bacterium]